jgi:hypothetical protein
VPRKYIPNPASLPDNLDDDDDDDNDDGYTITQRGGSVWSFGNLFHTNYRTSDGGRNRVT